MNHHSYRTHSVNSRHAWKERVSLASQAADSWIHCLVRCKKTNKKKNKLYDRSIDYWLKHLLKVAAKMWAFFKLTNHILGQKKSSKKNWGEKIHLRVVSDELWPKVHLPLSRNAFTIPEPTVPAPPRTNTTLSELDMLVVASHTRR